MRRKLLAMILSLAMVLSMAVPAMAAEDMSGKLVILHTNDMHGYYESSESSIGLAGVAAIKITMRHLVQTFFYLTLVTFHRVSPL